MDFLKSHPFIQSIFKLISSYLKVVASTMYYNVVCHEMKASVDYGIR